MVRYGEGDDPRSTIKLPCGGLLDVLVEKLEPNGTRGLQICITNPNGKEVSRIAIGLPQTALSGLSYIWPVMIGTTFDCEGLWGLQVQSGEYLLSRIVIRVSV